LRDESALVRGHAAWALKEIGGETTKKALQAAWVKEDDERARVEMRQTTAQALS
jgi:epoxyqueuosine reductase